MNKLDETYFWPCRTVHKTQNQLKHLWLPHSVLPYTFKQATETPPTGYRQPFLLRVTITHCESVFLNTIINGMSLLFIAYHRITHVAEIP
jgi:hypothetical protein